jgi:hypothetical protein
VVCLSACTTRIWPEWCGQWPAEPLQATGGGDAVLLAPALVGLAWDMVTVADGTVAGSGYDVLQLDDTGRILLDHQHILS